MMDLDEVYNSTIKKTQSLLESKGIALSLREIKKLDTINLSGFRNDGERLLRLELAEKYGLVPKRNNSFVSHSSPNTSFTMV